MKIGIDMDNTICSTSELVKFYSNKYKEDNNVNDELLWNNEKYKKEFLNLYLEKIYNEVVIKDNCIDVLNKLNNDNELYIITARSNKYLNNVKEITYNYLLNNGIKVNDIFINASDKVKECIENNIDIMIDDSYYNYSHLISNGIKTILFDDNKRYLDIKDRANNWNDVLKIIDIYKGSV